MTVTVIVHKLADAILRVRFASGVTVTVPKLTRITDTVPGLLVTVTVPVLLESQTNSVHLQPKLPNC